MLTLRHVTLRCMSLENTHYLCCFIRCWLIGEPVSLHVLLLFTDRNKSRFDCCICWTSLCGTWKSFLWAAVCYSISIVSYWNVAHLVRYQNSIARFMRILCQKIENSARVTCKFCAPFLWILHKFYAFFQADFHTLKLLVALLYDPVCFTSILA